MISNAFQNQPLNAADAISVLYNCVSNLREEINLLVKILYIVTSQSNDNKPQSKKQKMNQEIVPSKLLKKKKFDYGHPPSANDPPVSICAPQS